ncbi:hypothetical protein FB451DRAFT_1167010 [Mycena latifolia]|nr:hypothetical protein FB451DRAFT_1167010 [Mycena latifolia]
MFFSKVLAVLGLAVATAQATLRRPPTSTRALSDSMIAALEARDPVVARCAQTLKREDIVCARTEEEFVKRAYDEAARDVVLPPVIVSYSLDRLLEYNAKDEFT